MYHIFNDFNEKSIDIEGNSRPGFITRTGKRSLPERPQCWEFVSPVVGFPPGWFRIQNVHTGDLLRQDYVYNPPTLLPAPHPETQSHLRGQWEFQWTLAHSGCFISSTADQRNSWYIINRLTRGRLSPYFGILHGKRYATHDQDMVWKLGLDASGAWSIVNVKTSCLLQPANVIRPGVTAVDCTERMLIPNGSQSWILRY